MVLSNRIFGLDLLRAIAIILVVLSHSKPILYNFISADYKVYFLHLGLFGVEIFFVLSGFLIGSILINDILTKEFNRKAVYNFWIKRWFRTIPLYMFFLIFNFLLYIYLSKDIQIEYFQYFLFLQNFSSSPLSFMPEAWSLAVEEWFYIITPIVFYIAIKFFAKSTNKEKTIFYTILLMLIVITLNRWYSIEINNLEFGQEIRKVVLLRLDALLYGVLVAFLFIKYKDFFYKYQNLFFTFGLFIFLFYYFGLVFGMPLTKTVKSFFFTFVDIGFAFILIKFYFIKTEKKIFSVFSFIALISYSIYLSHLLIIDFVIKYFKMTTQFEALYVFIILIVLIVLVSSITYRYIEKPFMKIRKKYLKE